MSGSAKASTGSTISSAKAITLFKAQIEKIPAIEKLHRKDTEVQKWDHFTKSLIEKAFGEGTLKLKDFQRARHGSGVFLFAGDYTSEAEYQEEFRKHLKSCKALLETFVEELEVFGDDPPHDLEESRGATDDFLHIHPEIRKKCYSLYTNKSYAEAVEKSFKIVKDRLRTLTGYESGSGAFGAGKLRLKGASADNVEDDFNKAAQFLMMAIDMFRNEKSHTSDANIEDPIRAYQYLAMSSLALSLLENPES